MKRIKFLLFSDGKGVWFFVENPNCIEFKLLPKVDSEVFSPLSIKLSIPGYYISNEEYSVIEGDDDCCHIMNPNRNIKSYQTVFRTGKMKTNPGKDKQQEHQGIDYVPDTDPNWIEVYFFCCHISCFSV